MNAQKLELMMREIDREMESGSFDQRIRQDQAAAIIRGIEREDDEDDPRDEYIAALEEACTHNAIAAAKLDAELRELRNNRKLQIRDLEIPAWMWIAGSIAGLVAVVAISISVGFLCGL